MPNKKKESKSKKSVESRSIADMPTVVLSKWRCGRCGVTLFGPSTPEECSECGAGPEHFKKLS